MSLYLLTILSLKFNHTMKQLLSLFTAFLFILTAASSQDCTPFFLFETGASWTMESYNRKDKFESMVKYRVLSVTKENGVIKATMLSEVFDKKKAPLMEMNYEVTCADGIFSADLSAMLNPNFTKGFQDMDMQISGEVLTLPKNLTLGDELADAQTKIKVEASGIQVMSTSVSISERKVTDHLMIEVPAGSYQCFQIEAKQTVKAGILNREYQVKDFFAEGIGQVRSEIYNKKGKLESYTILAEYKRP